MNPRALTLLGLWILAAAAGCGPEEGSPPPRLRPNILLLVADTLRADSLAGAESLTPALDKLAGRSFVFHNAYTASPWTMPAIASLFTSRLPSQHGVNTYDAVLASEEKTLAEVLAEQGYQTVAFATNPLLSKKKGFHQGFGVYLRPKVAPDPWKKKCSRVRRRLTSDC